MSRVDAIRSEMASGVRLLGSDGRNADEQNMLAARLSGLPRTVVERLRWRKMRRVPADIADAIREAVTTYNRLSEARARHERDILAEQLSRVVALADYAGDPEFYRARLAPVFDQARKAGISDRAVAQDGGAE